VNMLWKIGVFLVGISFLILVLWMIFGEFYKNESPMWTWCSKAPDGFAVVVSARKDLEDVHIEDPAGTPLSDSKNVPKESDEAFLIEDFGDQFVVLVVAKSGGKTIKKAVTCGKPAVPAPPPSD
jgi:hypothetical protein